MTQEITTHAITFVERPYAERRLIVVDRTAEDTRALQKRQKRGARRKKVEESQGIGSAILDVVTNPVLSPSLYIARKAAEAVVNANTSAEPDDSVLVVGRNEAISLQFPPGHPQDDTVYVGHPLLANVYYPLAAFHRFLFEHKVTEAMRLLMSLGAKTMLVDHVDGWSREFAGNLSLPIPQADATVSASVSGKKKVESSILFRATLRGSEKPEIPSELLWFPHEPTWRQVAEGRIKFGLQEFSLVVNYTDDLGVNANLTAKLADMEFGIGGQFQRFKKTTWKIEGAFS